MTWNKTLEQKPEVGIEVIGFTPAWIDEDYNPSGTRVCFLNESEDGPWISAKWNNIHDCYDTDDTTTPTHWINKIKSPHKN